jgi:uncharacterized membrane protein
MKSDPARFLVAALWVLVVLYAVTFSAMSIHRHAVFETHGYDLGNADQTVYNTLHGCLFCFTNMDGIEMDGLESRLALHFEPILLPVSLTYLLYSSPVTLLVLQTVVLALGAWPAFLLARESLRRRLPAFPRPGSGQHVRFPRCNPGCSLFAGCFLFPAKEGLPSFRPFRHPDHEL